jgi:hypothetical protein
MKRIKAARLVAPAALSFACVELFNVIGRNGRAVANGWLVRRYQADGCGANVLARFDREDAARSYAALYNGPEADAVLNPVAS